jgi:hypothetical protein
MGDRGSNSNKMEVEDSAHVLEDRTILNEEPIGINYFYSYFLEELVDYSGSSVALVGAVGSGKTAFTRSCKFVDSGNWTGQPASAVGTINSAAKVNVNNSLNVSSSHTSLLTLYSMKNGKNLIDLAGITDLIRYKRASMKELKRMITGYMFNNDKIRFDRTWYEEFGVSVVDSWYAMLWNIKWINKQVKKPCAIHGVIIILSTVDNLLTEENLLDLVQLFRDEFDIQGVAVVITHKQLFGERDSNAINARYKLAWLNKIGNQNKTLKDYENYLRSLLGCEVFSVENYRSSPNISLTQSEKINNDEQFRKILNYSFGAAKTRLDNLNRQN